MKTRTIAVNLAVLAALSGCATVPAITPNTHKIAVPAAHKKLLHKGSLLHQKKAHSVVLSSAKTFALPGSKTIAEKDTLTAGGAPISLNFVDAPVAQVIQAIAQFTGDNIILSPAVTGEVTMHVRAIPWKDAFSAMLASQDLAERRIGKVLWVGPVAQVDAMQTASLEMAKRMRRLAPLGTHVFILTYLNAVKLATILSNVAQSSSMVGAARPGVSSPVSMSPSASLLGDRGSVVALPAENALLIRDTQHNYKQMHKLIANLDKPQPQVLVQAKFVEMNTNAAKGFGVMWGGTYTGVGIGPAGLANIGGTSASSGAQGVGGLLGGLPVANFPAVSPPGQNAQPGSLSLALSSPNGTRMLNVQLQALQTKGDAKIVSAPKVVAENNHTASIEQGTQIPYQAAQGLGTTSVMFVNADLTLKIRPHITNNNRVILHISAQNNQPNYAEAMPGGVPINTQSVSSQVLMQNNQTVVIGGLITKSASTQRNGVPLIQKIPLLGWLFHNWNHSIQKTELLIFVTPTILPKV
jgi:type IV pilus assembly protein PilQ